MKKVLMLALPIMVCASMASAQAGGVITVVSDPSFDSCCCELNPAEPGGVVTLYIVHTDATSATASQFMVDDSAISDLKFGFTVSAGLLSLGVYNTGIAISYAGCLAIPLVLGSIQYFNQGLTPPCALISVVPDPVALSGTIEVVDCSIVPVKLLGTGGESIWNGTQADCGVACCASHSCLTVSTEESTWGQMKALYN
jgi:hypothetical protein